MQPSLLRPRRPDIAHFNAAGAGLMSPAVIEAIQNHLDLEARRGAHWAMADVKPRLDHARALAADLFGVAPSHLAFGETASRLWALAFTSLPLAAGQRILVARNDWSGNILNGLQRAAAAGAEVVQLPITGAGLIDVEAARELIDERTAAICVSAVAYTSGLRQPVEALGALARPENCLYFVDAAQAIGQIPLDLPSAWADVMVAPGRKWLCGGRGQAMLALSERALRVACPPILLDQTSVTWTGSATFSIAEDARRFETFEFSVASRLGLGAALAELKEVGIAAVRAAIAERLAVLCARLVEIDGIEIFEREALGDAAFLTFTHDRLSAKTIAQAAAAKDIAIAAIAREQAPWELDARGLATIGRIAPHAYTSEGEIDLLVEVLTEICRR